MRKMKDSGVDWIGNIPISWKIGRTKDNFIRINQKSKDENPVVLSLARKGVKIRDISNGEGQLAESYINYNPVKINDLLLNPMDLYSGANCSVSRVEGVISPAYINLRPKSGINSTYYDYYFKTQYWSMALFAHGKGVSFDNRWTLGLETLLNYFIPIPPKNEQEKVANFLDRKVLRIERIIQKTKENIADYKKYKQSIITETVTKGLDKNGEMKDSGVEWINKIPEKWQVYKTKEFFEFGKGLPITKANLISDGEIVINYGQIHSKSNTGTNVNEELYRYVSDKYLKSNYQSIVKYNDFIFADTSEDLDGCGNCVYIDKNINVFAGYHTIILRPKIKDEMKYFAYLFLTDAWRSQIRSRVTGIKLFSITQKILKETTILIPEKKERKNIVKYLDKKCFEIDKLIKNKEDLITELENYKKSLIYEYVTGKKEVRNRNSKNIVNSKEIKINCKDNIFAQAILLCRIIEKLNKYKLGRVKSEKTLYLIEKNIGFNFNNNYVREAAGPLCDAIYKCESIISKKNKWVKVKNVRKHIEYEMLEDFNKYEKYYEKYYSNYDNKIEKIIEIIKKCSTDEAEMIATLYASWNDFIIKGEKASDIQIVKDVRENWNDSKKRFDEEKWLNVLNKMKKVGLVPKGYGNLTIIKEQ